MSEKMREDRAWMYMVTLPDGEGFNEDFFEGVEDFLKFATSKVAYMDGDKIRCPCSKCENLQCNDLDTCRNHIFIYGFIKKYYTWIFHGELPQQIQRCPSESATVEEEQTSQIHDIGSSEYAENLLQSAIQPLWNGHPHHTQLSTTIKLVSLKYENNWSETTMDSLIELIRELLPPDNNLPSNFCNAEKLLSDLGLPSKDCDEDDSEYDSEYNSQDDSFGDEDSCGSETDDDDDDDDDP